MQTDEAAGRKNRDRLFDASNKLCLVCPGQQQGNKLILIYCTSFQSSLPLSPMRTDAYLRAQ
jgi:hypothetical protein